MSRFIGGNQPPTTLRCRYTTTMVPAAAGTDVVLANLPTAAATSRNQCGATIIIDHDSASIKLSIVAKGAVGQFRLE